jgi:hypothetical protein
MVMEQNPTERAPERVRTLSVAILCEGCGRSFEPRRRDQTCCRPACRQVKRRRRRDEAFVDPDPARFD